MACCSTSTMAIANLDLVVSRPAKIAQKSLTSSIYNRKTLPFSNEFFISRGIPKLSLSSDNSFSVRDSVVDNSVNDTSVSGSSAQSEIKTSTWKWRGYSIRYQYSGTSGPALVLVHGFGANSDHWRKNLPVLAQSHRVYAIDLIGYGYSDKPNPRELQVNSFYTFETWGSQLNDFCEEVVMGEAFFVCNSIGGLVGLQAGVMNPLICKGIVLLNISLRMLHVKKQPWTCGSPGRRDESSNLQGHCSFEYIPSHVARKEAAVVWKTTNKIVPKFAKEHCSRNFFFRAVATPESARNILCQCYYDTSQVTDELVQIILEPGLDPGAPDVFLEFICYSGGPLPEELLPQVKCPVLIGWGDKDPWEPIELGKAYAQFDSVEDFVVLPNVGHCPQDEAPQLVNPLVEAFVARHSLRITSLSAAGP